MQIAYAFPEEDHLADSCFTNEEQECIENLVETLEGKTEKQKNNYKKQYTGQER